jgi:type IV pilus assembly protein PilX
MASFNRRLNKSKGFVLMVSLVMVIAITGIAVSLLSVSSMDMKMAVAFEDREMATHEARGGNDQLFYNAVNRTVGGQNYFAAFSSVSTGSQFTSSQGAVSTVIWGSSVQIETDCPRSKDPTEGLMCIYLQAATVKTFGPGNNNQINVVSGVAQQVGVR